MKKVRNRTSEKVRIKSRRINRVRAKIFGTLKRPRLAVFKSLAHIYCQLINDDQSKTIIAASDFDIKDKKGSKLEIAARVGKLIGERAKEKKISKIVFDRRGNKYHGRIKALAEAAREAGLEF